jgi:hypothetical protein
VAQDVGFCSRFCAMAILAMLGDGQDARGWPLTRQDLLAIFFL